VRVTRPAVVVVSAGFLAATGCTMRPAHIGGAPASPTARPAGGVDIAAAVRQWYRRVGTMSASRYFDPRRCGMNQPDTIWLLGGGAPGGRTPPMSPERSCAVAANRPILAPGRHRLEIRASGWSNRLWTLVAS
jgi:hypothetical protein